MAFSCVESISIQIKHRNINSKPDPNQNQSQTQTHTNQNSPARVEGRLDYDRRRLNLDGFSWVVVGPNQKQLAKAQGTKPGTGDWVRSGGSRLGLAVWVDRGEDGDLEGDRG